MPSNIKNCPSENQAAKVSVATTLFVETTPQLEPTLSKEYTNGKPT